MAGVVVAVAAAAAAAAASVTSVAVASAAAVAVLVGGGSGGGVFVEVLLIGYLLVTSLIGLYTIPLIRTIKPVVANTSLTQLILNCGLYVILSSALPLLSKILGEATIIMTR